MQALVENAKVMTKGQITIPKDIRTLLGLSCGDRVTFIADGSGGVRMVNSAVYAMQMFQKEMEGAAQEAGLKGEEEVMSLISELRQEEDAE